MLKPREVVVEAAAEPEAASDFQAAMFSKIVDLENHLKALKKRVQSRKDLGEDVVDRLKYIEEEIRAITEQWSIGKAE
ncbi:MAG: hypothetical protein ACM34H_08795 [Deltaproteobacteria bacterium]